jgi:signal transduction histidine kinase
MRLETSYRNVLRLLKLVNALLDFAAIEAGRAQASFAPTDLAAPTRDLASVFRSAIGKAELELILDCPSPYTLIGYSASHRKCARSDRR